MTNKVSVPKEAGDKITANYGGEVVEYKVSGGHVNVEDQHLNGFLATVSGAQLAGGNPASSKEE